MIAPGYFDRVLGARGDGRSFPQRPRIFTPNLVIEGTEKFGHDKLLTPMSTGPYAECSRYINPINGRGRGDFTGTIVRHSYRITDGKPARPFEPKTVRINGDSIHLFQQIIGVSRDKKPMLVWSMNETVVAPEPAVRRVGAARLLIASGAEIGLQFCG
jgi:predicted Zn-dependent protease